MSTNAATVELDDNLAIARQDVHRDADDNARLVERVGRILAVVPSLGPVGRAWHRLGFEISEPFEFAGCRAADLLMERSAIRFLAPDYRRREHTPLASLVDDRLILGAGILGWSWACEDVERAQSALECVDRFVPAALTPGVATMLEENEPSGDDDSVGRHENSIRDLDRVVLGVSDADAAADVYAGNFGLRPRRRTMTDRRYVFMKAGESRIEIVGPAEAQKGPLTGHAWGLAFRSRDLEATLATLHDRDVDVPEPQSAVQGGRVTSLPIHLGGIGIAFIGD